MTELFEFSSKTLEDNQTKRAIVLISGGLDSTTCLAIAAQASYEIYGLSIDYGQRHVAELNAAQQLAEYYALFDYKRVRIDFGGMGGSSLTDSRLSVPATVEEGIPNTYVPARNTVFLSIAMSWAETLSARAIFIGVNAVDYSGYPDCRPEFIEAFRRLIPLATKSGQENKSIAIETPLIHLSKAEIIRLGHSLGVDYSKTVSCYKASDEGEACGNCASCEIRRQGFEAAGMTDPTRYQSSAQRF